MKPGSTAAGLAGGNFILTVEDKAGCPPSPHPARMAVNASARTRVLASTVASEGGDPPRTVPQLHRNIGQPRADELLGGDVVVRLEAVDARLPPASADRGIDFVMRHWAQGLPFGGLQPS